MYTGSLESIVVVVKVLMPFVVLWFYSLKKEGEEDLQPSVFTEETNIALMLASQAKDGKERMHIDGRQTTKSS